MRGNNSNSQEKNRNNNCCNNRSKTGKDTTIRANNVSKECAESKCNASSSCSSTNKAVQEIERYTKEAENLVEALSVLSKLAEQLKPCIASKSQCSKSEVSASDEEQDSEPDVKNREVTEVPSKVRSEPARVRTEETTDHCLCCCSSSYGPSGKHKLSFEDDKKKKTKKDRDSDDETSGCCNKRKPKEKQKQEIIELIPLPMPTMTVVNPEEEPKREILRPTLQEKVEPEKVTVYPTVPAITTKAAMNLDDKQMQTDNVCNQCEMASNTDPMQIVGGEAAKENCSVCCQVGCGLGENREVGLLRPAITLNAIPFEEYAEKDFSQYWYDDVSCKCSTAEETTKSLPSPPNIPVQQKSPPEHHQQQQVCPQLPAPSSMMECYPYYNRNQPVDYSGCPGQQYQHVPQQTPQTMGINNANYQPPGGIVYKACKTKGSVTDSQKMQGFEEIDCIPNCLSTDTPNRGYGNIQSSTNNNPQPNINYRHPNDVTNTGRKAVQYQDQHQYDYYNPQPQQQNFKNQQIQYSNNPFAPCQYENIPQTRDMTCRTQDCYPHNRNMPGQQEQMQREAHERQLNNLVGQHYNTLFVDKADKDTEQSMKTTNRPPPRNGGANAGRPDECNGSCKYQNKKK